MTHRARSAAVLLAGAWLVFGCRKGTPDSAEGGTRNVDKPTSSAPAPSASQATAVVAGPAPSGAPRSVRESAVMAVLRGESQTADLPVVATDDGKPVDPKLRDTLAPKPVTNSVGLSGIGPQPEL